MKQQTVKLKYFCTKFTAYAQNVHHRPKRMRSDLAKVIDSFADRYLRQVIADLLQCTFKLWTGLWL